MAPRHPLQAPNPSLANTRIRYAKCNSRCCAMSSHARRPATSARPLPPLDPSRPPRPAAPTPRCSRRKICSPPNKRRNRHRAKDSPSPSADSPSWPPPPSSAISGGNCSRNRVSAASPARRPQQRPRHRSPLLRRRRPRRCPASPGRRRLKQNRPPGKSKTPSSAVERSKSLRLRRRPLAKTNLPRAAKVRFASIDRRKNRIRRWRAATTPSIATI